MLTYPIPRRIFELAEQFAAATAETHLNTGPSGEVDAEQTEADRQTREHILQKMKLAPGERELFERAPAQLRLAYVLPEEVSAFLIRATAPQTVWTWLSSESKSLIATNITKGFQRPAQAMRNPVVRGRILKFLQENRIELWNLLFLWGQERPSIVADLAAHPDDGELRSQLPALLKKHGPEALAAGLAQQGREGLLAALTEIPDEELEAAQGAETIAATPEELPETPEQEIASLKARLWEAENRLRELTVAEQHSEALHHKTEEQTAEIRRRDLNEKETRLMWEKKLANLEGRHRAEMEELKRAFERTSRKFKANERERADFEAENRRLKKQVRHGQQIAEELRKQLSAFEANPASIKPQAVEAVSETPAPAVTAKALLSPLDEVFEWKADGRPVRVTPRAVRRLIDRNDEDAVFTIIQALDGLAVRDTSLHGKFLKRMREIGTYYERVLTAETTRVLVDASNVVRYETNSFGKGKLQNLLSMIDELRRRDCFPIGLYADASLPYFIDEPRELRAMAVRGEVIMADKGQEADELLAREARRTGAYVVTNDAKFFHKVSPDFEPPRISFRIFDGLVVVDEF